MKETDVLACIETEDVVEDERSDMREIFESSVVEMRTHTTLTPNCEQRLRVIDGAIIYGRY